ncbi:MAG TPA: glutamine--tRNA ligase/YqeY domain fusion protein [bacterium]|nr:glutamine--tRNA ligase/YqeY domain fusion protein [bacterium]
MEKDNKEKVEISKNFIEEIIDEDLKNNVYNGRVVTRFPPEPNGYLHIGHAKSICLNFGLAQKYNGKCHLRFDDTNPTTEDIEYVESIKNDVKWLGFDWGSNLYFAADYFDKLYDYAEQLIKLGKAYVCHLTPEELKEYRGTLTQPGKESPYRQRSVEENLKLFRDMAAGKFKEGECVLRAKIDMASPNMNMRDPILYRIRFVEHYRTGKKWVIYPMYDFAHPLEDYIERITHSICTLEFEDHRPLYDWVLQSLNLKECPKQIEFARLNLSYTVMSKRKLLELVENKYVSGWDDPRLPTIAGLRRRGYTPSAIQTFCEKIGVAKANSVVDISLLEHCIREDLRYTAQRVMAVLRPLKVVLTNYPDDKVEWVEAENNPENTEMGNRKLPFTKILYIEQDDFRENPPKKYFRLSPGKEIRLKYAYYIKCVDVIKDSAGNIIELRCTYDPDTKGGWSQDGRKVLGTAHWVSAQYAVDAEVRLYDNLFTKPNPDDVEEGQDYKVNINPKSLEILKNCKLEMSLKTAKIDDRFQFLRQGYFCIDRVDSTPENLVFNRIAALRDSWAKIEKNQNV